MIASFRLNRLASNRARHRTKAGAWAFLVLLPSVGWGQPEGAVFFADEMLPSDLSRDEVILKGNVVVHTDTLTVQCERGLYLGREGRFVAEGSVEVESGSLRAAAPRGVYWFEDSLAVLTDGATAREPGRLVLAQELWYHVGSDSLVAIGDVCVHDSARSLEAHGRRGWFARSRGTGLLEGSPVVRIAHEGGTTTSVRSSVLMLNDEGQRLTAQDSVRLLGQEVEARASLGTFFPSEGRGLLEGDPRVIRGTGVGKGDRIEIFMKEGQLQRVRMAGNAAWAEPAPEDTAFINELTAAVLDLQFADGSVDAVRARGSAGARYLRGGEDGGVNDVHGDTLTVLLREGQLARIDVVGNAHGRFVPLEGGEAQAVGYTAHTAQFDPEGDTVVLDGDATLTYETVSVEAQRVQVGVGRRSLVASGSPVLRDGDEQLVGERMSYSLRTGQGVVYTGETLLEKAFYRGAELARVGSRELNVRSGIFTTCDLENPHYAFWARRTKVYVKDKVVAEPVVVKLYGVPVLALPSWVFPIRKGRHSGFLTPDFSVRGPMGVGGTRNFFRDLGYYFVLGDYADLRLAADWEEDGPTVLRGRLRYAWRYRIEAGSLSGSFQAKRRDRGWKLDFGHRQQILFGFRLTADIHLAQSRRYLEDQILDQTQRMNASTLRSHATLSRSWSGTSFRASWTRVQDYVNDKTTETLPEAALSLPARTLFGGMSGSPGWWGTGAWSLSSRMHNRRVIREGDDELQTRASHSMSFNWSPTRILRYIRLQASTGFEEVWQFRDLPEDTVGDLGVTRWGRPKPLSLTASTKLYGLWEQPVGPLLALRHVVTPAVGLSYTPDFYLRGWDFVAESLPDEGDPYYQVLKLTPGKKLNLRLSNLFQVKLRGDKGVKKLNRLASLDLSTTYDMEGKTKDAWGDPAPWGNLRTSTSLQPSSMLDFTITANHQPKHRHGRLRTYALSSLTERSSIRVGGSLEGQPGKGWSLSLAHSLSRRGGGEVTSHSLSAMYSLGLTPGWRLSGSWSYDLKEDRTVSRSFHVERDLHCWEAVLDVQRSGVSWSYTILLRVKEPLYREIKVEHHERRF